MTVRGTALLLGVFLVLLCAVWLTTPGPETARASRGLLPAEFQEQIARLEWEEAGRRIILIRDEQGWTDEDGRRLDESAVDELLDALDTVHPLTTIQVAPGDAAGYGLEAPRRLRALDAQRRVLLDVDVGRRNPAATGLYVRLNGSDEVLLVGALLDWELAKLSRAADAGAKP